ncbi:MAG: phosphate acyltransferase PlsX [Tissierellia bacterium]|nr:phosphate acyltransferase PlsX [Tissierellia bacterium]
MKILFDLQGGDHAPEALLEGARRAKEELGITPVFAGSESQRELLTSEEAPDYLVTGSVIENTEEPAMAIRRKKDSSIVLGMKALKEGAVDGMISAGSTGALLAGGIFILGRIHKQVRPCLPVIIPHGRGSTILLDAGANMDTTPEMLLDFAKMAHSYAKVVLDKDPEELKVGLLNVGAEEGKGDRRSQETYQLLKESSLPFHGNVEARDIFLGECDILVTDGFPGNILLKTVEGTAGFLYHLLERSLKESGLSVEEMQKFALVMKRALSPLDASNQGGVMLLGLKKPVIKAHGSSNGKAIFSAAEEMVRIIEGNVIPSMEDEQL